jgi:hypothetical protein
LSHDSNHAHLLNIHDNPVTAVREIKRFYKNINISPRICHSFTDNELEILRPYLEVEGFSIEVYNSALFWFQAKKTPEFDRSADIRRIKHISEDVIDLIHSESNGDWTINPEDHYSACDICREIIEKATAG